jgi:hypothetical protein
MHLFDGIRMRITRVSVNAERNQGFFFLLGDRNQAIKSPATFFLQFSLPKRLPPFLNFKKISKLFLIFYAKLCSLDARIWDPENCKKGQVGKEAGS